MAAGPRHFPATRRTWRRYCRGGLATVHKGQRGRVLVVGGSPGLSGAACLASEAALRAGAGLVTLAVPERLHDLMEIKLTEVMTTPLPETATGCISLEAARLILDHGAEADVLALGPGLGSGPELPAAVARIVGRAEVPLVIDADGLNALVGQLGVLAAKRAPLILTPHPGELARLANTTAAHVQAQRLPLARELAQQWGVVMVLKGARTIIAAPDGTCYINSTGGPALATGGSGDVLTGVIAGLLAQGLEPIQAAVAGVFVHGLAGDMAPGQLGGAGELWPVTLLTCCRQRWRHLSSDPCGHTWWDKIPPGLLASGVFVDTPNWDGYNEIMTSDTVG
jgi:hydroxyethylthiazole kinase-like uncharacterized protein yjeF